MSIADASSVSGKFYFCSCFITFVLTSDELNREQLAEIGDVLVSRMEADEVCEECEVCAE